MSAICDSATLALDTESEMLCSALLRSVWMPFDAAFSDCAKDCAVARTLTCADGLLGLDDSDCNAVVKLPKVASSVPALPGVP